MKEKPSKHKVYWKCYDCKKITTTPHTNIPKKCQCGCTYFKWLGNKRLNQKKTQVIIIDNNPLSIAAYLEEHPEVKL